MNINPEGTRLANAYNNGDKNVIRYLTGTSSFEVGPDGRGTRPTYGYMRKPTPAAPAPAPAPAPKAAPAAKAKPKPKPVQLSKEVATAIGRSQAYQDTVMIRDGDYVIAGDESVIDDFNKQSEQNIKEASKPYFERDVDPKVAQSYADKHKLTLGGDFILNKLA